MGHGELSPGVVDDLDEQPDRDERYYDTCQVPARSAHGPKKCIKNSNKISRGVQYLIVRSLRNERDSTAMTFMVFQEKKSGVFNNFAKKKLGSLVLVE